MHELKSLLIKLTHGVGEQDTSEDELSLIKEWLAKKYLTFKNNTYKFNSKYRAGILGLVQKGTAYLHVIGDNIKDLYIDELGSAIEGDLIIVKRILGRRGGASAKISEVVGREESYGVACIIEEYGHKSLVDIKTGHPVRAEITPEELANYQLGDLFKIDHQKHRVVQKLGHIDDPKVDEKIVLAQYNKHNEFDEEVLKIARSFPPVDIENYPKRKDLRELPFCTIDPVTAKDFDDAIYWDDTNSTLYVAIADVSEYVKPFGALDNEAMYRGFSIYLPHRSIPMLPRQLSETLCSLQPHVDRLAYVCEIKLDKETLEVVHCDIYEAIIHSDRCFNYEEIDDFFDGKLKAKTQKEEIIFAALTKLRTLTNRLKENRLKIGFDFHSVEVSMEIDEETNILSTKESEETPSHALIEDCMLLANKEAAKMYARGVFRIHEPPSQRKLETLYQELSAIGMNIEIKSTVKESIEMIQKQARKMGIETDVDTLIVRSQMQARYAPLNSGHFGLGFEEYTHFTSPIRRYSDLIVHRLIKAIKKGDTKESSYVLRNIETLAMIISEKEREASAIEAEYKARKYARWANNNLGCEFKARVVATEPEFKADLYGEIIGARINIVTASDTVLFENVIVRIDKVDTLRAQIYGTIVGKVSNV